MSLFRIDPQNPINGPHQGQYVATGGVHPADAAAGMILIHGRGASADSILMFANEFNRKDFHYRAPQAHGHAWYPRSFMAPKDMNEPGISSGLQAIFDIINGLNDDGIPTEKIVILGFSQGACLATEFAARHPQKYGGVVGLSGGLIGESVEPENYSGSLEDVPVFLGCSDSDPHIPEERVNETAEVFQALNANLTTKIYPNMGHTVNKDEISHINTILNNV